MQTFADFSKFLYNDIMDISSSFNNLRRYYGSIFWGKFKRRNRIVDLEQGSSWHLIIEIPPNFIRKFLSNVTNKTNLNKYLASKFLAYHEGKQSILCVAFGDFIISHSEAVLSDTDINQFSSEEADPRIVRHVINFGKKGYTNVQVKTGDSDVAISCLTYSDVAMSKGIDSFLVVNGPKEKKIDTIDNFNKFGVSVCKCVVT